MLQINVSLWSIVSWIITGIIGFITYNTIRFYLQLKNYPPGPTPLPLLGNVLSLRGTSKNAFLTFRDLKEKYGNVFTFWIGNWPCVFITDIELAKEAFNKTAFVGRPQTITSKLSCNEHHSDIIFADYGRTWESLRHVAHSAVRKYAISETLPNLTAEVVDEIVDLIQIKEHNGNSFNPSVYIHLILHNVIAAMAFGKKYTINDPEFIKIDQINEDFHRLGNKLGLIELVPIMRYSLVADVKEFININTQYKGLICQKFYEHLDTYQDGQIRDFADALIAAKKEALQENKESASYLTDDNLAHVLWDLFVAGTDTTQFMIQWMLLLVCDKSEVQQKLRDEIESVIGDRIPLQDDQFNCHYVNAFISETLRYRNVSPLGVIHKAIVNSDFGGHKIPKNTNLFVHQYSIMNDPKYWSEPEKFNPIRFVDSNGEFITSKSHAYIPFGIGRRICLGEKLASADLFLILVRFLQKTSGYQLTLPEGPGSADLNPDPNSVPLFCTPIKFNIVLNKL